MPTLRPDFHNGNLVSFSVATKQEAIVSLNYIRQPAPGGCLATFRSQRTTSPDRNKHDLWRFFAAKGGVSFEADGVVRWGWPMTTRGRYSSGQSHFRYYRDELFGRWGTGWWSTRLCTTPLPWRWQRGLVCKL